MTMTPTDLNRRELNQQAGNLPVQALPATRTELDAAAEEFEAMFLRQMLKQMRKASDVLKADSSLHSANTDTLREMHDEALADTLARRRQTGIADLLVRQLAPPAPVAVVLPAMTAPSAPSAGTAQMIANRVFGPIVEGWNNSTGQGGSALLRLADRVIAHESDGQVAAVSPKGALGLMQLMPDTAREVAQRLGLVYDEQRLTRDGDYNRRLGIAYLDQLLRRYDGEQALAVAAYNAGPSRVDQWLARNGDPRRGEISIRHWVQAIPFEETREYTRKILDDLQRSDRQFKPPSAQVALNSLYRTEHKDNPA